MIRFSFYYRTKRNTSLARIGTVHASNIHDARAAAMDAVATAYPTGVLLNVFVAKDSPWPVKDDMGELVAPSTLNLPALRAL